MFDQWAYASVKLLYIQSVHEKFLKNNAVFKEGDEADSFYIVVSGEFQVNSIT